MDTQAPGAHLGGHGLHVRHQAGAARGGRAAGPAGAASTCSSSAMSCLHRAATAAGLLFPRLIAVSVFSTVSCSSRSCSRRSMFRDRTT